MWPWGHAASGYLLYFLLFRLTGRRWPPRDGDVVALLFGTQFPDLVDKPLAWGLDVLPAGRSLAHSLITLSVVTAVLLVIARRHDRVEAAVAFSFGSVVHVFGDALLPILQFENSFLRFVLWPFRPFEYADGTWFLERLVDVDTTLVSAFGLLLTVLAVRQWWRDGRPGVEWFATRAPHRARPERD